MATTPTGTPGSKTNPHIKDPDATLDYSEDWSNFLIPIADTIASAVLVFSDPANTMAADPAHPVPVYPGGLIVTAWLKGGRVGKTEEVIIRITTVAGRKDDRTMFFKMVQK